MWAWQIIITVFTIAPSIFFLATELFRETKIGSDSHEKGKCENLVEGIILLLLVLAWIPTVLIVTTPGGAASMIGNAYFFTWLLVIFIIETAVWHVHVRSFPAHTHTHTTLSAAACGRIYYLHYYLIPATGHSYAAAA